MLDYITVQAHLPNKDFSDLESNLISIKIVGYNQSLRDVIYRYDLPAYLYNKLVDSQPKYKSYQQFLIVKKELEKRGIHSFGSDDNKYLPKHISGKLISTILAELSTLVSDAISIGKRDTLNRVKKIFVRFNSSVSHDRHEWTHGYMGEKVSMGFQFFIGYEIEETTGWLGEKETVKNYYTLIKHVTGSTAKHSTNFQEGNHLEPLHYHDKQSQKAFVNNYHILDWTQEREDFFNKHILDKFKDLDIKLKEYFSNLDNNKIELLMTNSASQKLLGE